MPKTIRVLKPFVFSRLPPDKGIFPVETRYAIGDHEIDDEMAAHPWIRDHFADGKIETPEQAAARLAAEEEAQKKALADAAEQVAKAQKKIDDDASRQQTENDSAATKAADTAAATRAKK